MIQQLTYIYNGSDLSGAFSGVAYIPILKASTLKCVDVKTDENVSGANAVFKLFKNGVEIAAAETTINVGNKIGTVAGLSAALARGDEITLNLHSGSVSSPVTLNLEIVLGPVTLTDGATINTDASLGDFFSVTLGGNRTLAAPTNLIDGEVYVWEFIQDGTGGRAITLNSIFAFGTDITGVTLSTTAGKRDYLTCVYRNSKLYVVGFVKGY